MTGNAGIYKHKNSACSQASLTVHVFFIPFLHVVLLEQVESCNQRKSGRINPGTLHTDRHAQELYGVETNETKSPDKRIICVC